MPTKVRVSAEPKFTQWLWFQRDRSDSVGRVARFAFADVGPGGRERPCWPHASKTVGHFVMHLRTEHPKDPDAPTEIVVRDAFSEFREFLASGGKVPLRHGGVRATVANVNRHRGYVLPGDTIEKIKELAEHGDVKQGKLLERLVAAEHRRVFGKPKPSEAVPS
jgi:hypothetical protein